MADVEMVERVARAIDPEAWPADRSSAHWGIRTVRREASIEAARAAIEALREPTEAMIKAGNSVDCVDHSWGSAKTLGSSGEYISNSGVVFTAMIDAILKEEGNG